MMNFLEIILFYCCKRILILQKILKVLENLFEYYFLNIIENANFFSDFIIAVSTTVKYCYKQVLNKKLKLIGRIVKYFLKKFLSYEIFSPMVYWATKFSLKNLWNPPFPSPTYLMYTPLSVTLSYSRKRSQSLHFILWILSARFINKIW